MPAFLSWWRRGLTDPAAERRARFFESLHYAIRRTRFYGNFKPPSRSDERAVLAKLPKVPLSDYLRCSERFEVPGVPGTTPAELRYPLGKPPRTAILGQNIRGGLRVRQFQDYRSKALTAFAPAALAGPLDALRGLAQGIERREIVWKPLTHALLVHTDLLRGPLPATDRDFLWRVFQVPVFEQFHGSAGELLAWECEVHDGLHLEYANVIFEQDGGGQLLASFLANRRAPVFRLETGLSAQIVEGRCPCGTSSPRLINLQRLSTAPYTLIPAKAALAMVNSQ